MNATTLLAERAAHFCRTNHASRRDLPTAHFWDAIRALPDQAARTMATSRLTAGLAIAAPTVASATTLTVTSNADSGAGSLRAQVAAATAGDTIAFDASLSGQTITLTSGQIKVLIPLTIQGPGSAHLTIDGNDAARIFYLYALTMPDAGVIDPSDITISGLTIQHGYEHGAGGGIYVAHTNLTLTDIVLHNNTSDSNGGGLRAYESGAVTIQDSVVSGNTGANGSGLDFYHSNEAVLLDHVTLTGNTSGQGGALYFYNGSNTGALTLQDCTVTNNTANGNGGGLRFDNAQATITIDRTTVSGNSSLASGGGVWSSDTPSLVVTNSTVSGNTADGKGAGLFIYKGESSITNATITGNVNSNDAGLTGSGGGVFLYKSAVAISESTISGNSAGEGGGVYANYQQTPIILANSIVAGNTRHDLSTKTTATFAASFSLIQDFDDALFMLPGDAGPGDFGTVVGTGNISGMDPALGALADNGGPTMTMLPASTSLAINAGDPNFSGAPTTDQRGVGFARVYGAHIDMGAVEVQPPPVVDAGTDGGSSTDAGSSSDAGSAKKSAAKGCACSGAETDVALALLAPIGALLLRRRRARSNAA